MVPDDIGGFVIEQLHHDDAVLVVDETGVPKKVTAAVGVQCQYIGIAGRIENSQASLWRDGDFRCLWVGQLASQPGEHASLVVLPLFAVMITVRSRAAADGVGRHETPVPAVRRRRPTAQCGGGVPERGPDAPSSARPQPLEHHLEDPLLSSRIRSELLHRLAGSGQQGEELR